MDRLEVTKHTGNETEVNSAHLHAFNQIAVPTQCGVWIDGQM